MSGQQDQEGEFLWLVSLSDLMMLLFVFFVVLFSFSYKNMSSKDVVKMNSVIKGAQSDEELANVQKRLVKWVVERKLLKDVDVLQKEDGLVIQIKEKILFSSGGHKLGDQGRDLVRLIGKALTKIPSPYRIGIEGHTDNSVVLGNKKLGNWELSSKRAVSVLNELNLPETVLKRTVVMAFGPHRPLLPNHDKNGKDLVENQAKNRRVAIRVF